MKAKLFFETKTTSIILGVFFIIMGGLLTTCTKEIKHGSIQGVVTNSSTNEPIHGVNISLSPTGLSAVTGSDGRYEFNDLEAGQYTVQGVKEGYETNTKSINIVAGNVSVGDMTLKPEIVDFKLNVEQLDFGASFNQLNFKVINISNSLPISWNVTESLNWLEATPSSGSLNAGQEITVLVTIDRTKIDQSTTGNIVVEACDKSLVLPVSVTVSSVNGPQLQLSETSLDFGVSATSLSFYVLNTGPANTSLNWTCSNVNVDWLSLSPTSGNTAGGSNTAVIATIDRSKIDGEVSTSVTVSGAGSTAAITFRASTEGAGAPILQLSEGSLNFGDTETTLSFLVKNVGSSGTTLDWAIVDPEADWLTLTPMTGHTSSGSGTRVTAAVDRTKFTGTVTTTVRVNSQNNYVDLSVSASNKKPSLEVSTEIINFGGVSISETFKIKNSGDEGTTLQWNISTPTVDWLAVSPSSGNLNAGSSKTVTLTIDRTKFTGDVSTTLVVTAGGQSASVQVTATTAQATLVVTHSSIDFGKTSNTKTFTVKNTGEEGSVLHWVIDSPTVDWLAVSPAAGSINANGSRVVTLTLDRTKFTGSVSTTLQVTGEGQSATIDVMASSVEAAIAVSQTTVDFGTVSYTKTFTITNEGDEGSVLEWSIASLSVDWLAVSPTSGSLNANGSRVVTLTIDRTKFTGSVSTTLQITGSGQSASVLVAASTSQATLAVSQTSIDFGKVSTTKTFNVKNEGEEGSVLYWNIANPTVDWLAVTPSSGNLNANSAQSITLTIDRTKFTGDVSTMLQITGGEQSATVSITASTAQFELQVTPEAVDFGTISTTKTFTVKNNGEAGSNMAWSLGDIGVDWLTATPMSGGLGANQTATVTLTLDRTKFTGDVSTSLQIIAGTQSATVTVSASTPVPAMTVSPTAVDFGTVSTTKQITISNTGESGSVLNWTIAQPSVSWLTVSATSGSTNANNSTTVTLTIDRSLFTGDVSTSLQITAGTQSATVTVSASTPVPAMTVSPTAVDFGTISTTKQITISNTGESGSVLNWTIAQPSVAWLAVSAQSGSTNANNSTTVTLTLDRSLFTGDVSTSLQITAGTQSATVTVTASTPVPAMTVSPTAVDFGTISTTKQITISNTGESGSVLNWTIAQPSVAWLAVSAQSGSTNANNSTTVTLTLDRSLFTGDVSTSLQITAGTQSATVTVTASTPVPAMTVSPTAVDFGTISITKQITISNTGESGSVLNWTIAQPSVAWLTVSPSSGNVNATMNATVTLTIDRNAFVGVQNTSITITGAGNTVNIPITVDNTVLAVNGLIAYYTFDDGQVTDWGGNYNGTNAGAITSSDTPNNQGYSMEFNGTSSYLHIPNPIFQTGTTWSYNMWFKTGHNNIAFFGTNTSYDYMAFNSNSKLFIAPYNYNSMVTWTSSVIFSSYLNNQWHMLTISWNGSILSVYVDASLVETANLNNFYWESAYNQTTYFGVKKNGGSFLYYFNGKMDNIRTYNRALTQAEITILYNSIQ